MLLLDTPPAAFQLKNFKTLKKRIQNRYFLGGIGAVLAHYFKQDFDTVNHCHKPALPNKTIL